MDMVVATITQHDIGRIAVDEIGRDVLIYEAHSDEFIGNIGETFFSVFPHGKFWAHDYLGDLYFFSHWKNNPPPP